MIIAAGLHARRGASAGGDGEQHTCQPNHPEMVRLRQ